jgi:hypothetical protein
MDTKFNFSAAFLRRRIQSLNLRRHHAPATAQGTAVAKVAIQRWPGKALVLAAAMLALGSVGALAQNANANLQALALLTGTNYVNQRNNLLQQYPAPYTYNISSASAYSWGAGLEAYILNAWLGNATVFSNWTSPPMLENERGDMVALAAIDTSTNGQAFWIEQVWKTAPNTNAAAAALASLLSVPLDGTVPMWSAVYYNSPVGPAPGLPPSGDPLQQIAAHALASLPGQSSTPPPVIDALSNPSVTQTVMLAALSGLEQDGPPDATSVLLAYEGFWSTNADTLSAGYLALSAQTNNDGRDYVYADAQNTNLPVLTRMTAVAAFTATPITNDIVVLQEILTNNVPSMMTNQINGNLEFYSLFFP